VAGNSILGDKERLMFNAFDPLDFSIFNAITNGENADDENNNLLRQL